MKIEFSKMHGLGNDFMVIDLITQNIQLTPDLIKVLGSRQFGVGFDQMLIVEPPERPDVDFKYRIFNADGSEVEQCGNGVRCFARFVHQRNLTRKSKILVSTNSGVVEPEINSDGWVRVNMGQPKFSPSQIPFITSSEQQNSYTINVNGFAVELGTVNMGNPHAVILVDDVRTAPVQTLGPAIESHPDFPNRVNVGFMQVLNRNEVNLRVFERGVGETLACGTGACAAVVSGITRGLLNAGEDVTVHLSGGDLMINWTYGNVVWMTGPTAHVFDGVIYTENLV